MRFYRLVHDDDIWVLGPRDELWDTYGYRTWLFGLCQRARYVPHAVPFEIDRMNDGSVDFNHTVYGAVVVSRRCADLLRATLDAETYEFVPAEIEGAEGDWEVLNILDCVDCLDHEKSLVRYHDENHARFPGKPRSVERMIIDPRRAAGHDLFRLKDWMVAVIASDRIKDAFQEAGITGLEYWPVC